MAKARGLSELDGDSDTGKACTHRVISPKSGGHSLKVDRFVPQSGFEPPTPALGEPRSIQLSYWGLDADPHLRRRSGKSAY